ncbi:MAG: TetR/AcrR family transcriptional regulator [Candidatus Azobacteroides sp.]|nr:TetR/AcrR family transcriptional regulator [Candidatus Azobacteroides sp.]
MELKTANKEQIILEVAEKHFIEKGFAGTKTTEIANDAGVNHALLHYYYRTKENLFSKIFEQKASQLLSCVLITVDKNSDFFEKLKEGIENHFEMLRQNPKLPLFILREVVTDKNRRNFIEKNLFPIGKELFQNFNAIVRKEIKKGTIRPVRAVDLLLNIASLNVFAFVVAQILFDSDKEDDREKMQIYLEERKRNNVELIINSLKQ